MIKAQRKIVLIFQKLQPDKVLFLKTSTQKAHFIAFFPVRNEITKNEMALKALKKNVVEISEKQIFGCQYFSSQLPEVFLDSISITFVFPSNFILEQWPKFFFANSENLRCSTAEVSTICKKNLLANAPN